LIKKIKNFYLILGLLAGCLLKYGIAGGEKDSDSLKDSFEDIFLLILLPPIIFEGAVNMDGVIIILYILFCIK
jgi:hypothetical protein